MRRLELLSVVIFRCSSLLVTWQRPCSLWSMKCNLSSKSIRDANYSSTFFSYSSLYSRVPREWRAPPPILVHTICDVNYTSSYNSSTRWRWGKLSQWTRNHGQLFFLSSSSWEDRSDVCIAERSSFVTFPTCCSPERERYHYPLLLISLCWKEKDEIFSIGSRLRPGCVCSCSNLLMLVRNIYNFR